MERSDFVEGCPGTFEHEPLDNLLTFVPSPLPANWSMPPSFWPLLMAATEAIRELNGIGWALPNPYILLTPLQNREAIQSSRIEGTFATAREFLLFEIGNDRTGGSPDDVNRWREVHNYRDSLTAAIKSGLPISKRLIRNLHSELLNGVRGEDKNPGEFRTIQVGIRGTRENPKFVPPPFTRVESCLDELETYINAKGSRFHPLIDCFLVHYQLETIHPFRDGNGRVGRLLLSLMVQQKCNLDHPWLFISQYFERHQDRYFELMYNVSTRGDWSAWLEFCLEATVAQAKDALERCQKLLSTKRDIEKKIQQVEQSNKLLPIVELLLNRSSLLNVNEVKNAYKLSYPTASKYLEQLVEMGILRVLPDFSPKTYYCPELFRITYQDLGGFD